MQLVITDEVWIGSMIRAEHAHKDVGRSGGRTHKPDSEGSSSSFWSSAASSPWLAAWPRVSCLATIPSAGGDAGWTPDGAGCEAQASFLRESTSSFWLVRVSTSSFWLVRVSTGSLSAIIKIVRAQISVKNQKMEKRNDSDIIMQTHIHSSEHTALFQHISGSWKQ